MGRFRFFLVLGFLVPSLLLAQKSERQKLADRLSKDLQSRDAATRVEAAESFGKLEMVEGVEPLAKALSDRDPDVRRAAASALWSSSEVAKGAIPALRAALNDSETSVIIRAAGALIAMDVSASSLTEPLRLVLQRGDEVDRFLAARALIGVDSAGRLAPSILDYLRRNSMPSKDVEVSIARADNFESGSKALISLAETQDRSMVTPLMAGLKEPLLTRPILVALGNLRERPDRWIDTLLGLLSSPDGKVRETSAELLGKQTAPADVKVWAKPLSRVLSDSQKNVRDEAIRSLKEARGLALVALPALLQELTSEPDAEVRVRAAEAVGELADASFAIDTALKAAAAKDALPVLTSVLDKDSSTDVRTAALKSINKLELEHAAAAAILARAAVEQKNSNLRLAALQALRNRGRDAAMVADTIRPLKSDSDEWVRKMADATLESMQSSRGGAAKVTTATAVDPAARERALGTLRDLHYQFTEEAYYSALSEVQLEIVTAFLDAGMSPNQRFSNSYGDPALRVVLDAGAGCDPQTRPTPPDTKAIVKLLLARGGDPNIADDRGNTPLMTASEKCDAEVVKLLLGAKASMNVKNGSGMTAFEFGLWNATDGAAAIADAGFRLSADKVKMYSEAYAKEPKKMALVRKATKK